MSIPNLLSIGRMILVPIFVITFFGYPDHGLVSALILVLSGITDCLDGMIARKFNMITSLGKILDPLADKLTQLAVCICLAIRHKEFIIILCLLIAKELIMLIAGFYLIRRGTKIPSSRWFGKVATVVFYCVMVYIVYDVHVPMGVMGILIGVVILFAVLAFIQYIPQFKKLLCMQKVK
ncbi:MAG: CDP-alcohol phosphatidyltransferase family protein [Massiliimalia sp.]|jgi:cardiolipin synthase